MSEWADEQLPTGTPHDALGEQTLAQRIGASETEVRQVLDALERDGVVERDGERLVVVEQFASRARSEGGGP